MRAGDEGCFVGLYRDGLGQFKIDARVERGMGNYALEGQSRIGDGDGWMAVAEPQPDSKWQKKNSNHDSKKQTDHFDRNLRFHNHTHNEAESEADPGSRILSRRDS
jgi:hypothetical protein